MPTRKLSVRFLEYPKGCLLVLIVLAFPNSSATILSFFFFLFPLRFPLYFSLSLFLVTEPCPELTVWLFAAFQECAPVPALFLTYGQRVGTVGEQNSCWDTD